MKKSFFLLSFLLTGIITTAQVGIGTDTPAASLDVISDLTDLTVADGILAPRVSRANLVAKVAAYGINQTGTIVYVNDVTGTADAPTTLITSSGYYFFDGANWQPFTTAPVDGSKWTNNTTNSLVELTNTSNGTARTVSNSFQIEDLGNVGIGIVPSQKLDVDGNGIFQNNLFITGVPGAGERGLRIHKDGANTAFFDVNSGNTSQIGANTAFSWRGDNANGTTELMSLLYNGNISTGGNIQLGQRATTNRSVFIDFNTVVNAANFEARLLRNAGDNGNFALLNRGTGNINIDVLGAVNNSLTINGTNGFVALNKTTAPTAQLDVDGSGIFSGTVTANGAVLTSDLRLKKDIVAIENSLETVQQLNPVYYSKKERIDSNDYNRKEFGFIAQELQKVLPQLVIKTKRDDKVLGVDYISLIPILTKAIQEQQVQLDAKTNETAALQLQVNELKKDINAIKRALKL